MKVFVQPATRKYVPNVHRDIFKMMRRTERFLLEIRSRVHSNNSSVPFRVQITNKNCSFQHQKAYPTVAVIKAKRRTVSRPRKVYNFKVGKIITKQERNKLNRHRIGTFLDNSRYIQMQWFRCIFFYIYLDRQKNFTYTVIG